MRLKGFKGTDRQTQSGKPLRQSQQHWKLPRHFSICILYQDDLHNWYSRDQIQWLRLREKSEKCSLCNRFANKRLGIVYRVVKYIKFTIIRGCPALERGRVRELGRHRTCPSWYKWDQFDRAMFPIWKLSSISKCIHTKTDLYIKLSSPCSSRSGQYKYWKSSDILNITSHPSTLGWESYRYFCSSHKILIIISWSSPIC